MKTKHKRATAASRERCSEERQPALTPFEIATREAQRKILREAFLRGLSGEYSGTEGEG
jgi:hypothetical protein